MRTDAGMAETPIPVSTRFDFAHRKRSRFRAAMILAVAADALQLFVFPAFVEGAFSAADDVLDVVMAAIMIPLLGWHWEFLPTVVAKLVPGVDLVPFWTLAVANVYRKWKRSNIQPTEEQEERPTLDV